MNTYADDIHKHLRCKERKRYMFRGLSVQLEHRTKLIRYLEQICEEKKYCVAVQHLAAYLLDIFMDNHRILSGHLEIALIVCIILAAKLEEQDQMPPKYSEFQTFLPSKYELSEFLQVEIAILSFYEWNIMFPTAPHFTEYYLLFVFLPNDLLKDEPINRYQGAETCVKKYIEYFLDVVVQKTEYLQFYPSLVAAACIASTRRCLLIRPVWPETLQSVTLYKYQQIEPCVELLLQALDEDLVKNEKETLDRFLGSGKRKLSQSEDSASKIIKS
ncbi:cyclin-J [Parasteatoda tepidariorum]|uniref:cyclin-J n=1 Tax=Parasteatoda tepidariorum TaxID=114398 RepID=UPI00077F9CDB|nr:cyclin-J [Parasteatoda tepidariorum]